MNLALGTAVVLSMIAVCCGIGAISAPWFMAELLAVLLAEAHARRLPRTKGWIAATSVLLAAVLLVASSAWLTTLAFTTRVQSEVSGLAPTLPPLAGVVIAALTTVIALASVVPLFYAPVILLDIGGNVGGALLESVRLVVDGGFIRHLLISLVSHVIQLSPLLIAAALATWVLGSSIPTAMLMGSPLLAVSLPIGQGMFVTTYSAVRSSITDPRRTRFLARPPKPLIIAMLVCLLSPVASLFAFGGSLVRPSHITESPAVVGEVFADVDLSTRDSAHIFPIDTTLDIAIDRRHVRVNAGDGGGAGTLPLRSSSPIQRVRVRRDGDTFQIEITQNQRTFVAHVGSAGVRQDDDLGARMADRAPLWAITFMLGTLLLALMLLLPPVYQLALVRRLYTLAGDARPSTTAIHERRRRAIVHGWIACGVLTPAIIASLVWAIRAVLAV